MRLENYMKRKHNIFPYQNPNLSVEERTEDLLSRMTLDEKIREICMHSSGCFEGERSCFSEEKADKFFAGMGIGALEAPKFSPQENANYMNAVQKYLIEKI